MMAITGILMMFLSHSSDQCPLYEGLDGGGGGGRGGGLEFSNQ